MKVKNNKSTKVSKSAKTSRAAQKSYYLEVLHVEFNRRQSNEGSYSLNQFARDLGVESSILSRVMSGKRLLSYKTALKMTSGLKMKESAKQDFLTSVETQTLAIMAKEDISFDRLQRMASEGRPAKVAKPREGESKAAVNPMIRDARAKIDRSVKINAENSFMVVTQAIQGAEVFMPFLEAIENFQRRTKAKLCILPGKAHLKPLSDDEFPLDARLFENHANDIYRQIEVNRFLSLIDLDIRPYVVDPLNGLTGLGAEECRSYIIAHTTQRMKTLPNEIGSHPRIQQCTGALTLPLYRSNKSGLLGDKRHVMGAVILDIGVNKFIPAAVQADVDGSFIYNGVRYSADGSIENVRAEAIIRGDEHIGFQDPKANSAVDEIVNSLQPRRLFIHDLLDSASISHHREKSIIQMLAVPKEIKTLALELAACTTFLEVINKKKPKDCEIFVVASNHNEHLHRYLDERRWAYDKVNIQKAAELFHYWVNHNKDPMIQGVDPEEKLATWLRRGDKAIRVGGVVVSTHGDKGPNGARGSIRGESVSFGTSSAGHSHSPEKLFGSTRVGTLSVLDMDYTIGAPSGWAHAVEALYLARDGKTALRQLMLVIEGEWRINGSPSREAKKGTKKSVKKPAKKSVKSSKKKKRS